MFTSAALEVNRHEFEDSQYQARESHADELTSLLGSDYSNPNIRIDANPNIRIDPPVNPRRQPPPAPEREQPTVEVPSKPAGRTVF